MIKLDIVSDDGYQSLITLKDRKPELFTNPDPQKLKSEMIEIVERDYRESLWDEPIPLEDSLDLINENPTGGPVDDAKNATILRQALPSLSANAWSHQRLWASINCFALAEWVPVRWSTSRTKRTKEREFVHRHWLKGNTESRESNASMRLFTLDILASRAAKYSSRTGSDLLSAMAENVNLFHQTLRRPYLLANSRILAMIWDAALDDESNQLVFQTKSASKWLATINERGGAVDLSTLDDDSLRAIVQEAKPRPKVR